MVDPQSGTAVFGPEEASLSGYDDVDDFDGANFSPPINSNRQVLNDLGTFSQRITVENVSNSDFTQVVAHHSSDFVRITVKIFLNSKEISFESWVRARY